MSTNGDKRELLYSWDPALGISGGCSSGGGVGVRGGTGIGKLDAIALREPACAGLRSWNGNRRMSMGG